jgi:hypothetical protein
MSKAIRVVLGLSLLVALLIPIGIASAQLGAYGSSFQVQNLANDEATIAITFYNQDGTVATTVSDAIDANSSNTYFAVTTPGLPDGFNGSAVISADQPIRAIHNLDAGGFVYGASSSGYTAGADEVSLPLIMRNNSGFNTWFNVQNAGSGTATVDVSFKAGLSGTDWDHSSVTIEPGAAYTFDQSTMTNLGDVFVGSATVTSNQPVVATVVEVGPDTLYAYDGFIAGDPDIIGPLFQYNNAGFSSSVQVQNIGDASTNITLEYTPSFAGVACEETQTVAAGAAGTFGLFAFAQAGNDCFDKNGTNAFVGSVTVKTNSASQDLVAIVNQHNFSTGKASAYSAFGPDEAKQCTSLPLIMDRNSNYWTGLSLINVGADTTVTIDYSNFGTTADETIPLTSDESAITLNNGAIQDGYVGSAQVCGASASDQILVIVNEQNLTVGGDQLFTYNGFPLE